MPSGDLDADLAIMRDFFSGISGKYPDQAGDIQVVDGKAD
jgi:hypothetical protein